jgi:TPR repeat protein
MHQYILLEEALYEKKDIYDLLSSRFYQAGDFEKAINHYDKASEYESLAQMVTSLINSTQSEQENA